MLIDFFLTQTSIILRVKIRQDSTGSKPGQGMTGLTSSSTGLIIAATADNEATATAYTSAATNIQTIATLGTFAAPTSGKCRFAPLDATNHPGIYEIQLDNSRFAVSACKSLTISLTGVSGMADCDVIVPLRSVNPYDSQRFGLAALPSTGTLAVNPSVNVTQWLGATPGGAPLYAGTSGTGAINTNGTGDLVTTFNSTDRIHLLDIYNTPVPTVDGSGRVILVPTQNFNNTGQTTVAPVNATQFAGQTIIAAASVTIPASIGTSTYAGADTSGTTTLLTRIPGTIPANGSGFTALGDTRIANLDAAVSTRSTYAGGAVASVTAPVTVGGYASGQAPDAMVWGEILPGSYGTGTAGYLLGESLQPLLASAVSASGFTLAANDPIYGLDQDLAGYYVIPQGTGGGQPAQIASSSGNEQTLVGGAWPYTQPAANFPYVILQYNPQIPPDFTPATFASPGVFAPVDTNLTNINLNSGTVSASPAPTLSGGVATFAATGNLNLLAGSYTAKSMEIQWQTGDNAGLADKITADTVSGSTKTFTTSGTLGAVQATDTFLVV